MLPKCRRRVRSLEKAESLPEGVWVGGVEPICSAGQVSAKALAWWF